MSKGYSGKVLDLPVQQYRNLYLVGYDDGRHAGRCDAERQLAVAGFVVGALFIALLSYLIHLLT